MAIVTGDDLLRVLQRLDDALPLPTGAATAAKQDTGNTMLAAILAGPVPVRGETVGSNPTLNPVRLAVLAANGKVAAVQLGLRVMAESLPVVLASDQAPWATHTAAVAAGATGAQVINAAPGRIGRVLITAAGVGVLTFYDNASAASGTIVGIFLANPAVGTVQEFDLPVANGITAGGGATMPGYTVSYV